jgi:carbon-monoxide dehydrogenase medium subunit
VSFYEFFAAGYPPQGEKSVLTPYPTLPEFEYVKPASLEQASRFLAEHEGRSRPFLGGTDVFVRMRDGVWTENYLVDVKGLNGTDDLHYDPSSGLSLGAAVNMNRVIASPIIREFYPLLAEAARTVASYQLRTRATIAGNICNASPAGDTIGACLVLGARLRINGVDGVREEPLATFFTGPGRTVLKAGDIVTAILFPVPPDGFQGRYIKLGRNALGDLAIVGITALGCRDTSTVSGFRFHMALASVAPTPLVPAEAQTILADNPLNEATIERAAEAAMNAATPIDDVRSSARYRKLMVRNLARRALLDVWMQLR